MTIAVDDVHATFEMSKSAGLETAAAEYRISPIYGNVLIGIAMWSLRALPLNFVALVKNAFTR